MKKLACQYAIVQFVPYVETGEFANVGIVLICPQTEYFGFKLQTKKFARVTGFFNGLDRAVYVNSVRHMEYELERLQKFRSNVEYHYPAEALRNLFTGLIHPREAIMRFGEARPIMADDPVQKLDALFDHYVDHAFATEEYMETQMTKRIQSLLRELPLLNPFRPQRLGDNIIHARFDFVQQQMQQAKKVIKPFNLAQAEPNSIYTHGDVWLSKVKRLQERNFLPKDTLFTVTLAPDSEPVRRAAGLEIIESLKARNVEVVDVLQEQAIREFALA